MVSTGSYVYYLNDGAGPYEGVWTSLEEIMTWVTERIGDPLWLGLQRTPQGVGRIVDSISGRSIYYWDPSTEAYVAPGPRRLDRIPAESLPF